MADRSLFRRLAARVLPASIVVVAATAGVLSGCASLPEPAALPTGPAWNERAARLPAGAWAAWGRFSVSATAGGRLDSGAEPR